MAGDLGLELKTLPSRGELTISRVHEEIRVHHSRVGRWPSRLAGPVPTLGITFAALDTALKRGSRGLPRGSSLGEEVAKVREAAGGPDGVPITLDRVRAAIAEHRNRTGSYPGVRAGHCEPLGINWKALNERLRQGTGDLAGGSSVAREVAEVELRRLAGNPTAGRAVELPALPSPTAKKDEAAFPPSGSESLLRSA